MRCRRWRPARAATPAAVHALTRGNPFFVAETLAAPPDEVPASVKDAVLARLRGLGAGLPRSARAPLGGALARPARAGRGPARRAMRALPEAELAGVIEDRPDGLGFRHELARRAIEQQPPGDRRAAAQPGRRRGAAARRIVPSARA